MRSIIAMLTALAIMWAIPAHAAPPTGKGGETTTHAPKPKGDETDKPGKPPGPGKPSEPGKPPKPGKPANPDKTDKGRAGVERAASDPKGLAPLDQERALNAVRNGEALPLADIIKLAEAAQSGRVIDAKLMEVQSLLVYRLTMLSEEGVSRRVYYYARSGNPIRFS